MDFQLDPSYAVHKILNKLPIKTHINLIHSIEHAAAYITPEFSYSAFSPLQPFSQESLHDWKTADMHPS